MGSMHINTTYVDDDGSTVTIRGDLDITRQPAGATPAADLDPGAGTAADPGSLPAQDQPPTPEQPTPEQPAVEPQAATQQPAADAPADPTGAATGGTAAGPGPDDEISTGGADTGADAAPADTTATGDGAAPPADPTTTGGEAGPNSPDPGSTTDTTGPDTTTPPADSGPGSSSAPVFPGDLHRNDRQHTPNADVRTWQTQATAAGVDCGPVDGFFGRRTEAGVKSMQYRNSLPVTGILDQPTWDATW